MNQRELKPFWGILHFHITSDLCHYMDKWNQKQLAAAREQIDATYRFARETMGFDFAAYADHHNMGQMIAMGTAKNSPWNLVVDAWSNYNQDGNFVSILGYEYQDGQGEYNVYLNRQDMLPNGESIDQLIKSIPQDSKGVILAAHNRPRPTDWRFAKHRAFRLAEIINDGGMPFEQWTLAGLQAGHKVGFIGGSDDHECRPGLHSATCVWAESLSRDHVWEALAARRTVATTGIRPRVWFEMNGHPLGSEFQRNGCREGVIRHDFPRQAQWVGIIKNGLLLRQYQPHDSVFELNFSDDGPSQETDFYYAKIIYRDGHYAYTSPIWVSCTEVPASKLGVVPSHTFVTPHYRLQSEFGNRVGRNCWFNASGLFSDEHQFFRGHRDMVCHLGPDPLLVCSDNSLIYPTMDAVVKIAPQRPTNEEVLYTFTEQDDDLVLTSLCELEDAVILAGYQQGQPTAKNLQGESLIGLDQVPVLHQYLYKSSFVSPSWLDSDGGFFCILSEREGVLFSSSGKVIGYFQQEYPAFPVAVRMRSLDEVYVLGLEGRLVRYSFAASNIGKVVWTKCFDRLLLSLALTTEGVLVFNGTQEIHNQDVQVCCVSPDGCAGEFVELNLKNLRGVSLAGLPDGRLAGLHNDSRKIAVIHRAVLNETGTVRLFNQV